MESLKGKNGISAWGWRNNLQFIVRITLLNESGEMRFKLRTTRPSKGVLKYIIGLSTLAICFLTVWSKSAVQKI